MYFLKKQLFVQFHSVNLCTESRVLLFEENWILKIKFTCTNLAVHVMCNALNCPSVYHYTSSLLKGMKFTSSPKEGPF